MMSTSAKSCQITGFEKVDAAGTDRGATAVEAAARENRDVNLDIGEKVFVDAWNPDGTASVRYRGAQWTVMLRAGNAPSTGEYRVAEVVGSRLVVDKI